MFTEEQISTPIIPSTSKYHTSLITLENGSVTAKGQQENYSVAQQLPEIFKFKSPLLSFCPYLFVFNVNTSFIYEYLIKIYYNTQIFAHC